MLPLLALGAVGLVYYATRETAEAAVPPGTVVTIPGPGGIPGPSGHETGPGGGSGGGTGGGVGPLIPGGTNTVTGQTAPPVAVAGNILHDDQFRQIYAFQSLGYSAGLTQSPPDGRIGSKTRELMTLAGNYVRNAPFTSIDYAGTQALSRWIKQASARGQVVLRNQPNWLPIELVISLNRRAIGYDTANPSTVASLTPIQTGYEPGYVRP